MLPPFVPLPYETAAELLAAAKSGVQFLFVRTDQRTAEPATLKLCAAHPGNVRALDKFSMSGDSFSPNGCGDNKKFYLVLAEAAKAKPTPLDQVMPSDKAAVTAYRALPKAAPVPVAQPVVAVKPNDGLLAMANPDDKRFVWGVKL